MIEIGPGRGILTTELARRAGEVRGVELDGRLCRHLREQFRGHPSVSIEHADFLRCRLPRDRPYKVVGNIPFARTTDIVERLTSVARPPEDAFLVVQKEAAERFAGSPWAPESEFSLRLKPWWHVEIARRLRRTDFEPAPRVESVALHLARRTRPLVDPQAKDAYLSFVGASFGRTGNTIGRCLRTSFNGRQIRRLGRDLRFDVEAPPSHLTFDQWLGLFRFSTLAGS